MYRLNDWDISVLWSADTLSGDDGRGDTLGNGNRLMTGNGYLGRRGVVDEADADGMPATILAGLYDRHGDLWREPVNSPDPLYTLLLADTPLRAGDTNTVSHEQALNFRYGIYSRRTSWRINGGTVTLLAERYAHIEDVHLLCARYTIKADIPCRLFVKQGINGDVSDLNGPHLGDFHHIGSMEQASSGRRILGLACSTQEQKIPLAVFSAMVHKTITRRHKDTEMNMVEIIEGEGGVFSLCTINLDTSKEFEFFVYGSIYSGLDRVEGDPSVAAISLAEKALNEGWESLLLRHKSRWDAIWRTGDVVIEGDDYAQRCLRYSLYHLWIIAPRHCSGAAGERALSIPARGLSGQTYKGAVFWDTEMFISPYFLSVMPELAAQFIRYRVQTLPGAKRKAAEYGYRGAFFAWESQETGDDACSDFNVTDVFTGRPVRTYFRDKQIHISADIVYSIKKYVDQTGDLSILIEGAMELILEAARFYVSYLYYSPERKRYEAPDVIGPDEYHERVNNNAFTNRMIYAVFETARDYVALFKKNNPDFIYGLIKRIDCNDDLDFMEIAMGQFCLQRPGENGLIEQFDGYFRLEDCTLETVRSRLKDPREYWGGGNGVASTTRIIKQADVVTMLALFGEDFPAEVKKANLDYYEPRTEHGSSLSSCMYALLACETGGSDWAYPFFIKSAEIDITGASKHYAGLVYIGGTHPAASGGAWMTVVRGFCGFSINGDEITVSPRLPEKWKKVQFTVIFRRDEYQITVTRDNYSICKK